MDLKTRVIVMKKIISFALEALLSILLIGCNMGSSEGSTEEVTDTAPILTIDRKSTRLNSSHAT